jgi:hypothetical protein
MKLSSPAPVAKHGSIVDRLAEFRVTVKHASPSLKDRPFS